MLLFNATLAKSNRRAEGSEVGRCLTSVTEPEQKNVLSGVLLLVQHVPLAKKALVTFHPRCPRI